MNNLSLVFNNLIFIRYFRLKKNIYLKNYDNIFNQFFNFDDIYDDQFFIFLDIFLWDCLISHLWRISINLNLLVYFKKKNTKKWLYLRLIYLTNIKLNKLNSFYIKYDSLFFNFKKLKLKIFDFNLQEYFFFNKKQYFFKLKHIKFFFFFQIFFMIVNIYYKKFYDIFPYINLFDFFFFLLQLKICNKRKYYKYISFFFLKNILKYYICLFLKKKTNNFLFNIFFFKLCFFLFFTKFLLLVKNKKKHIFSKYIFNKYIFIKWKNIYIFDYLLKEKQKIKQFFYIFEYKNRYKNFFFKKRENIYEYKILRHLILKKKFRRTKQELLKNFLNKKKKFLILKKRTNKEITMYVWKKIILKNYLQKKILYFFCKYFFINNVNYLIFLNLQSFFFLKNFLKIIKLNKLYKFQKNLEYIFFLNLKEKCYYLLKESIINNNILFLLNDRIIIDRSINLDKLIKTNIKNYNINLLINLGNFNNVNKITIDDLNIKFYLNKKNLYFKKRWMVIKNIIPILRFLKNKKYKINIYFLFTNIYLWLFIFFKLIKKSIILNFDYIKDFISLLKILKLIISKKFFWNNVINNFIDITIVVDKNLIYKFIFKFNNLMQELCLYIFFLLIDTNNIFNFNKYNNLYSKINILKNLKKKNKDIKYFFKGQIALDMNYDLFLVNISNIITDNYFIFIIKDFLINCKVSLYFIKIHFNLYLNLINFNYLLFDKFIININEKFFLKKKFFYIRYLNIFLIGFDFYLYNIVIFLIKNCILYFLYYILNLYLFICFLYDLTKQKIEFFNYILYIEKNKLVIKIATLAILRLFFLNSFIQIKKNKISIIPVKYLLSLSVIKIYNYFFNILYELYYYYFFFKKQINKYIYIIKKACFLTINLKIKNKNKFFKFYLFKKLFKFQIINKKNNNYKKKYLNNYLIKNNNFNLNLLLKILNKKKKKKLKK